MGGAVKAVTSVFGGLLGGGALQAPAPLPVAPPPTPAPQADEERLSKARRRAAVTSRSRRGRAATILTGPEGGAGTSDTLG